MPAPFSQTVIAVVWDFDKTLIPGNMQRPLFRRFGVDEATFWEEVDGLSRFYLEHGAQRVAEDSLYLNHILEYVRAGVFEGLSNALLHELGAELAFHPGMPRFLATLKASVEEEPDFERADITLEHYVVSTGLRPMIEGSAVMPFLEDVWACEFIEAHHPPGYARPQQRQLFGRSEITALGYQIDNTSKTRALFEINKGTNKHPEIHVNSHLPAEMRRVPFEHMIYVADGPSDVPAWSVVKANGGLAFGVYQRGSAAQFEQISALLRDGRIHAFAEADYTPDSTAHMWLTSEVRRIAERIVEERAIALRRAVRAAPRHVGDVAPPASTSTDAPMEEAAGAPHSERRITDPPGPPSLRVEEIREAIRHALDDADLPEPGPVARPEARPRKG